MSVYDHYSEHEWSFIDQVKDWKDRVSSNYSMKRTDFLNPREQHLVQSIIGKNDEVQVHFYGGYEHGERKRAIIAPAFFEIGAEDFECMFLSVQYPVKFHTIEHPQVLGALTSLGIKREKYGDILIMNKDIQIVVAREISSFLNLNLTQIHRSPVELKEISVEELIRPTENWVEKTTTVPSERVDVVVSQLTNMSRQSAQEWILREQVSVNYQLCTKTDRQVKDGDFISIRKKGRYQILSISVKTKKDRIRMVYSMLR